MTDSIKQIPRIRKIELPRYRQRDILTRLRSSRAYRILGRYLKQLSSVRRVAGWIRRSGYPIYLNHVATRFYNNPLIGWRPLSSLSEFASSREISTYRLMDAAVVATPEPKIFPNQEQGNLTSDLELYSFPEIFVCVLSNATAYAGTNLVLVDGEVVCHDLYDFERDYTSEELHWRALIDPKCRRVRWLLHDAKPEPVPIAATFFDSCSSNYAHWMTEVLPRIALFCAEDRFRDIPIIIDDGLHGNIMESLSMVTGAGREIITVPRGRAVTVKKLYLTSVAGYVPFERRNKSLEGHSSGHFSPLALGWLGRLLSEQVPDAEACVLPKKIYLRRNARTRNITNASEIEQLLKGVGYTVIEPEKLTFSQQIQLFRGAHSIVGPTGAAFANGIFCRPGAQLTVLMAKHESMIYRYWSNMLAPIGVTVNYILGNIVEDFDLGIHGRFQIDANDVADMIERSRAKGLPA